MLQNILKNQARTRRHWNEVMSDWNSPKVEVLVICFVSSMITLQAYHGKLYTSFLTQPILSLKMYNTSGLDLQCINLEHMYFLMIFEPL